MVDQLLINVDVKGQGDIQKVDKGIESIGKSTVKTTNALSDLKKELKDAKSDMLKFEEGTKQYNQAMAKAAQASFKLKDASDKVKASVIDVGQTSANVGKAVSGIAGGFAVAQGAIALFGVENENAIKTIMKLQATLSVVQGLAQFADSIESIKDLFAGFAAASTLADASREATTELGMLSKTSDEAAHSMSTLSKESAVLGSNMAGATTIANENKEALKILTKEQESSLATLEKLGVNTEQYTKGTTTATEATKAATIAQNSFTASILKTLLTMAAITAAIVAVVASVSWLIDKYNEIPKDLEIKIGIEEESLKQAEKASILIKGIQNDLDMIPNMVSANNNKQLDAIKSIMIQNGIATEEEIKALNAKEIRDSDYFNRYLQKVKDVAYNEAIIKRQVEAETQLAIEEAQKAEIYKSLQSGKSSVTFLGLFKSKEVSMIQEADEKIKGLTKSLNTLNSLKLRPISVIAGLKPTGGGTKTATPTPIEIDRTRIFQETETETLQSKAYKISLRAVKEYTEEEVEIIRQAEAEKRAVLKKSRTQEVIDNRKLLSRRKEDLIRLGAELSKSVDDANPGFSIEATNAAIAQNNKIFNAAVAEIKKQKKIIFDWQTKIDKTTLDRDDAAKNGNKKAVRELEKLLKQQISFQNDANNIIKGTKTNIGQEAIKESARLKAEELDKTMLDIKSKAESIPEIIEKINQAKKEGIIISAEIANADRDLLQSRLADANTYLDAIGELGNSIANAYDAELSMSQDVRDRKIADLEATAAYAKMSEKQKASAIYAIQKDSYEKEKELFKKKKLAQEAAAIVEYASGLVTILSNAMELGPIAGPIVGGLQATALTVSTLSAIKQIRAQQLDKPTMDSSTSAGVTNMANISLNPTQDALTSKEEMLNTMNSSNKVKQNIVVKVSDINKVQNDVKVRESNQSY